jgi:hypothetical protein
MAIEMRHNLGDESATSPDVAQRPPVCGRPGSYQYDESATSPDVAQRAPVGERPRSNQVPNVESARQKLARLRDELRLELHLMRAEARDEWHRLEDRWPELERASAEIEDAAGVVAEEVRLAAARVAEELTAGYERLRRMR